MKQKNQFLTEEIMCTCKWTRKVWQAVGNSKLLNTVGIQTVFPTGWGVGERGWVIDKKSIMT